MCTEYTLAATETFLGALKTLSGRQVDRLFRKVLELRDDPHPDGTDRKQRVERYDDVYRLRVDNYRVFYRIRSDCTVVVLGIDHRKDAYRQDTLPLDESLALVIEPEEPAGSPSTGADPSPVTPEELTALTEEQTGRPLLRRLTAEDLRRLAVPPERWTALLACRTEEELLDLVQDLPQTLAGHLLDLACGKTVDDTLDEPAYVLPPDLSPIGLLEATTPLHLLLDHAQRRVLERIRTEPGPFLVTGGPGTGKTVVALLAVPALLERARAQGAKAPRALYLAFNRTLAKTFEQLARHHLSEADRWSLDIETLDRLVTSLVPDCETARDDQLRVLLRQARQRAFDRPLSAEASRDRDLARSIRKLSDLFLRSEIEETILGRGLRSLDEYRRADRQGRQVGLNETQREAVWRVYEALSDLLREQDLMLPGERRLLALEELLRPDSEQQRYDAVVVDEVHDLTPVALRLVTALCVDPTALVLCGDTGQSIYRRDATWKHLVDELPTVKRLTLTTGHRAPPEFLAAARSYLEALPDGTASEHSVPTDHRKRADRARPRVVALPEWHRWPRALPSLLEEQLVTLRLTRSQVGILVPTNDLATNVAAVLGQHDIPTEVVARGQPLTASPSVKVLTWHNAKGLEFPCVIVLLPDWHPPPAGWNDVPFDEVREVIALWRRAAYVAMTRATRTLLVLRPVDGTSPLLAGLRVPEWDWITWEDSG
ncbi:MAG: AAA family ATPase [Thermomicrobium sp.]|nr:AAA family ATPase [Thermomicrobium sp.]